MLMGEGRERQEEPGPEPEPEPKKELGRQDEDIFLQSCNKARRRRLGDGERWTQTHYDAGA